MALILRNGGSQSSDRWLKEPRNNHLIQVRDAKHYHFDNKDLQEAFTLAELPYKDEMDIVYAYLKDNKVGSDVAAMAGVFADHGSLIESGIEMDKDAAGCGDK